MQGYSLENSVVAPLNAQRMEVRGTQKYPLHGVKTQRRREKSHHTVEEVHGKQQGFVRWRDREYQGRRPQLQDLEQSQAGDIAPGLQLVGIWGPQV